MTVSLKKRPKFVVYICGPNGTVVLKTERDQQRWCFNCRKRLAGRWDLLADDELGYGDPSYRMNTPIEAMSYYDPWWAYRCDGCGGNYRHFPGRS